MKLFVKKAAPKKAAFTAINNATLKQVKGGGGISSTLGILG